MVFVGIAVALFGWLPRLAIPLTWGVLAAMWFVVLIGDALHLPSWLLERAAVLGHAVPAAGADELATAGDHDGCVAAALSGSGSPASAARPPARLTAASRRLHPPSNRLSAHR